MAKVRIKLSPFQQYAVSVDGAEVASGFNDCDVEISEPAGSSHRLTWNGTGNGGANYTVSLTGARPVSTPRRFTPAGLGRGSITFIVDGAPAVRGDLRGGLVTFAADDSPSVKPKRKSKKKTKRSVAKKRAAKPVAEKRRGTKRAAKKGGRAPKRGTKKTTVKTKKPSTTRGRTAKTGARSTSTQGSRRSK